MVYHIYVTREDGWWVINIPAIDGTTQARRITDIPREATDYIVTDQDVAPSDVTLVHNEITVGDLDISTIVNRANAKREAARLADAEWAEYSREAALELAKAGVPVRDIGEALQVSYQRAHQLTS